MEGIMAKTTKPQRQQGQWLFDELGNWWRSGYVSDEERWARRRRRGLRRLTFRIMMAGAIAGGIVYLGLPMDQPVAGSCLVGALAICAYGVGYLYGSHCRHHF
jgi:hypothetical protein